MQEAKEVSSSGACIPLLGTLLRFGTCRPVFISVCPSRDATARGHVADARPRMGRAPVVLKTRLKWSICSPRAPYVRPRPRSSSEGLCSLSFRSRMWTSVSAFWKPGESTRRASLPKVRGHLGRVSLPVADDTSIHRELTFPMPHKTMALKGAWLLAVDH